MVKLLLFGAVVVIVVVILTDICCEKGNRAMEDILGMAGAVMRKGSKVRLIKAAPAAKTLRRHFSLLSLTLSVTTSKSNEEWNANVLPRTFHFLFSLFSFLFYRYMILSESSSESILYSKTID